ncbi:AbrB family transcriptional regulator [Anoxybacter fermentans]|uniref:AbrB family transcriptional regulator n=1 Tax=Anoxybacter fermentans TaxID=1323375 RepID=A0A3Q9HQQ1_9FIRM|nr:AbrB/MazE/SpoVT family DNA-binding domain-containing protein [Anoxybacter fermentans]AZR73587.1 AbrB family transcriptional regulator [Anoxybacter fermentans]
MQATGIVRKIDELGRIVIPIDLRRNLNIDSNDPIEILVGEDEIVLRKFVPTCVFCGNTEDTFVFKKQSVCRQCQKELIS